MINETSNTANGKGGTVRIESRLGACRCGCGGTDPWHARFFRRALRDVTADSGAIKGVEYGAGTLAYDATATVRFPWGFETVYRVVEVFDNVVFKSWSRGVEL